MVRAILFDFDGVIAESMDIKTDAFARLFEGFGPEIVKKVVAHHQAHGGVSRFEKIRLYHEQYLGKVITDEELSAWCRRFSDLVLDAVVSSPYVPGALELLESCHKKYSCFIITGTPQEEMEEILSRKGLKRFFAGVYGSPTTKTEIVKEIMSAHKFDPKELIYIGDAMTDYEAAKGAGIRFIGRVPKGKPDIFPSGTFVVPDLRGLHFD